MNLITTRILIAILGIALGVQFQADAAPSQPEKVYEPSSRNLLVERNDIIKNCIGKLKDSDSRIETIRNKDNAIETLSQFRAVEAIYNLSEQLVYLSPDLKPSDYLRCTEDYYRCAVALVSIGNPSIDKMLGVVETSKSIKERHLAAWVVFKIDGKEQAIFRFDRLALQEKGDSAARLREASIYIQNYVPSPLPPDINEGGVRQDVRERLKLLNQKPGFKGVL